MITKAEVYNHHNDTRVNIEINGPTLEPVDQFDKVLEKASRFYALQGIESDDLQILWIETDGEMVA